MISPRFRSLPAWAVVCALLASSATARDAVPVKADEPKPENFDWQVPNENWKNPFKDDVPIVYVNRGQNRAEWEKLPEFWNLGEEKTVDPVTGQNVVRKVIKIKVPLGLTQSPSVPVENPMTLLKWQLGKKLYFDNTLSSDGSVSCASCHDPKRGFTDQSAVSTGIKSLKGGMSAPTVINSAYNTLQFWDGRAISLEDQAQGPVQNAVEMFDGQGHAWYECIKRLRKKPDYVELFKKVFGTEPTRDGAAKAIAAYERTVLSGNSIHDRAEVVKLQRLREAGLPPASPILPEDYAGVLKDAAGKKDDNALKPLGLSDRSDAAAIESVAKSVKSGRDLFFDKARCNLCHAGDNFTDNLFHNLGVGVKDGQLAKSGEGRFAVLPTGHKAFDQMGAFKTPTLRALGETGPYMHDGSEKSLEDVIELYNRGGNPNPFLDSKMRDLDNERAFLRDPKAYKGPKAYAYPNGTVVVPLELRLTDQEKKDLVNFLKALQGDAVDPIVADKDKLAK